MRHDDLVAEACRDHHVRLGVAVLQQPAGAEFAAPFFVVGEMQLDAALQGDALVGGHGFQRPHRVDEGGEVAFADGGGAAIESACVQIAFDLATVGRVRPAFAGGHDIAVGVEGDGGAVGAVATAHDQVGDAFQSGGVDFGGGDRVAFHLKAQLGQQLGGAFGVGGVVARRGVGGDSHQGLQQLDLLGKVGLDPSIQLRVGGGGQGCGGHACSLAERVSKSSANC